MFIYITKKMLLISLLTFTISYSQITSFRLTDKIELKKELLGKTNGNTLKMYDIVVDQKRGLAYTSGILSHYIAIIDIKNNNEIGSVYSNYDLGKTVLLYVNPVNGYLVQGYLESTPNYFRLINPQNNDILGECYLQSISSISGFCVDAAQNYFFVADNQNVKILNGDSFDSLYNISMPFAVGDIDIDTVNQRAYFVSKHLIGGKSVVRIYNSHSPFTFIDEILVPSTKPMGRIILDIEDGRFFLLSTDIIKVVDISTKTVLRTITISKGANDFVFADTNETIYSIQPDVFMDNGEKNAWSCIYKINVNTGAVDSLKMGEKASRLDFYKEENKLTIPDMHSGIVELYNIFDGETDTVDIGESADYMVLSPDKNNLYIVKRLGGSRIVNYQRTTKEFSQFYPGSWPSTAEVDEFLNRLFVVNHFESSVSVFNATTAEYITNFQLQVDEGRTDAILSSYLDENLHKLFITFPEFEKVFIVNTNTYSVQSVKIPNFTFDSDKDKGIGVLQSISDPISNRLFTFFTKKKMLYVFNLDDLSFIDSLNLQSYWSSPLNNIDQDCLLVDTTLNVLFVGNIKINPQTLSYAGKIPKGTLFLGKNNLNTKSYCIELSNDSVYVHELNPTNLFPINSYYLYKVSDSYQPVFKYEPVNNDIFIAEFNTATVRIYSLDEVVSVSDLDFSPFKYSLSQNYPNPFNPSTTIKFELPEASFVKLTVYNLLGEQVAILNNKELNAGVHNINFNAQNLPSGIYLYRIETGKFVETKKMLLIK